MLDSPLNPNENPLVDAQPVPAQPSASVAQKRTLPAHLLQYRWNSATAAQAQRKRDELRRAEKEALKNPPQIPGIIPPNFHPFLDKQIVRVREHIERIDERLAKATDPLDIDRLARARGTLSEQERILDGRPLPGSHRPSKARGSAPSPDASPV